ncbi:hypothetical protein Bca52824_073130 [Brassica carinata]|uniref:Uncharacterized protein n=1 Tax=Brassica carinata TaxID=52824 RepID=A0A8X7Q9A0_BRACI|nr:hypothetical protein Bca52824_073130 [Brassica carinata]
MDVQVFTKRFLHQCYLFDCLRGAQPFCNVDHEWVALADEDHPHSIFFVDGVSRQHQDLLSFKILTVKALNQACGVPFIGAEVLTQPPWLLEEFNMNREERETARSWLFMSESDIPGDPWVATGQRRVYGIECTMYVMNRLTMSKRSASSTPSMTNRAGSKRRVDSPVSRSDRFLDPGMGSEYDLAAPLPYAYASPPSIAGTHPVLLEGEETVVRARQLPLDRRQVPFLLSDSALHRSSLWGNMSGNTSNDPFAAYQEAANVMSAKKDFASRTVSGDDMVITGSRRAVTVKIEPSALVQTKTSRGGGMPIRSSQQSAEVAHSVGSLATALSNLNLQVF